jgi:hypothetical protein
MFMHALQVIRHAGVEFLLGILGSRWVRMSRFSDVRLSAFGQKRSFN